MPRTIGRRSWFFAVLALIGFALLIPTPPDFRSVTWLVIVLALFWAVASAIEDLTAPTFAEARSERATLGNPFAPPPAPGRGPAAPGRRAP
jgi:hypothetical protein